MHGASEQVPPIVPTHVTLPTEGPLPFPFGVISGARSRVPQHFTPSFFQPSFEVQHGGLRQEEWRRQTEFQ
jgi:hypothetical protein